MTKREDRPYQRAGKKEQDHWPDRCRKGRAAGPAAGVCCGRKGQPARPAEQHLDQRAGWHCAQAGEEELKQHHEEERLADH